MKLIAGLGNPGREYESTPHNVGFDVVDAVCRRLDSSWRVSARHEGLVAKASFEGEGIVLLKPMTFMNASGRSVSSLMRYHRMEAQDVIVVLDDVELPPGKLRIRPGGGDGGHNGLASLIEYLGTTDFIRLRIGVGRGNLRNRGLTGHVLGRLPPESQTLVDKLLPLAADALLQIVREGVSAAMNSYNGMVVEGELHSENAPVCAGTIQEQDMKEREAEVHVKEV